MRYGKTRVGAESANNKKIFHRHRRRLRATIHFVSPLLLLLPLPLLLLLRVTDRLQKSSNNKPEFVQQMAFFSRFGNNTTLPFPERQSTSFPIIHVP